MKSFTSLCIIVLLEIFFQGHASAEVVIVVSAKSAVTALSKEQITAIYLGRVREFPNGAQVIPITTSNDSVKTEFLERVLNKTDAQVRAIWSKLIFTGGSPPRQAKEGESLVKLIAENPNTLGYLDSAAADSTVRVVFRPEK